MTEKLKKYETIACCGIDCGLCPRFYTKGDSACPGCGGENFKEKHPSCGFLTCCTVKKGLEVCSDCPEYPCKRFDSEKEGYDSFVTHRMVFTNLDRIKDKGIEPFIAMQNIRMDVLKDLLERFDEGRSKSFYCLSCALLPLETVIEIREYARSLSEGLDLKEKSLLIKNRMNTMAESMQIVLKLNKGA